MEIADFIAAFQGVGEALQVMPPPENPYSPPHQAMVWYDKKLRQYVMSIKLCDTESYVNVYLLLYFKEGQIVRIERRAVDTRSKNAATSSDSRVGTRYSRNMLKTIWKGGEFESPWVGIRLKRAVPQTEDSVESTERIQDSPTDVVLDVAEMEEDSPVAAVKVICKLFAKFATVIFLFFLGVYLR